MNPIIGIAVVLGWFIFSIAVGQVATLRGRKAAPWFFISLFLSPFFACLLLIAAGSKLEEATVAKWQEQESAHTPQKAVPAGRNRGHSTKGQSGATSSSVPEAEPWKCPECGNMNPGSSYKCLQCTYKLV